MTIKKAELHVHLESTITPELAALLAKRNKLPFPEHHINAEKNGYASKDFMDFLQVYDVIAALIKAPQDYYDITYGYLKDSAAAHTIYTEMMYSPDHAERSSGIPSEYHLEAIQKAIDDAYRDFGIVGRIIITAVRHFGVEAAERVAKEAQAKPFPAATGFGLGGDELNFPPKLFARAYAIAKDAGLQCTVHAGEFGAPETMQEAMRTLPIVRIGHGVQAMHCKETQAELIDRAIALELCPTSNINFKLFKDMAAHPLPQFLKSGIKISISSDDPPFVGTTIDKEYQIVQKSYSFSDADMNKITAMAIEDAFVDKDTKQKLAQAISGQ